ncbi:SpoIID/LytB domain-containing protein [Anaerotignum lactatifermentans]|uniref:SpoIID/LytB domain-containing protein n=1 Tax=Anaerotignum lactatifermentans TaxID=160404 RepID=A0ABS2G5A5_9FIRM|nr:SpoIID/LytB domain-containing protein [Anaerotignum lactatifermentans]MBM6828243.1 SpoIID/LytB domain-containing protein [Anaerotignum lactatifermentans]MBM6876594.1 SpoIID/LytB domain-containing protein [Anaerotignum lactatifermentans]MBM6949826.1 SpoIID/LytB domain-containing protein [Anaerotignum lactatifermentans]
MRRILFLCLGLLLLCGCAQQTVDRAVQGRIGDERAVSRAEAAKMISLAFYGPEELAELEQTAEFPDVSKDGDQYAYINGAVSMGFFSGDEDGNFYPEKELTLTQAQFLVDRLAPEFDSQIILTEENKNLPVSYSLWVQLWETALEHRRGEEDLSSYGIEEQESLLLKTQEESGWFDKGNYWAAGIELMPYLGETLRFWQKDGEIVALLEVTEENGTAENVYCHATGGRLQLETGNGTVSLPYSGETVDGICDVVWQEGALSEVIPAQTIGLCTVKRVNGQEIYLGEQGLFSWAEGYRVYDGRTEEAEEKTVSALICGMAEAEYFMKDGKICGAVLRERENVENIRVLVGGTDGQKVTLSAEGGFTLSSSQTEKEFMDAAALSQEMPWFDHGIVTAKGKNGGPMKVVFSDGTVRSYYGTLELERRQEKLIVINELSMETYLKGVVPHEMPVSFGETALEAQAITARSYAYNRIFSNELCGYGAHVDDTVSSQVYLGAEGNSLSDEAVDTTRGLCLTSGNAVVTTYFYSTSCGYGASAAEVWQSEGEEKTYLIGGVHGVTGTKPETEEEWLEFWQDWDAEGYDKDSPWFRWKVYFGVRQLSEITAAKLAQTAKTSPGKVEIRQEDDSWKQGTPEKTGLLKNISVEERGESGVVKSLLLEYENGTVRVKGEYAIRQVLSPMRMTIGDPVYLQKYDGTSTTDATMLPSGFFAVKAMTNEEGRMTGAAFYGGGSGHGVGMSQYGAKSLAEQGKTAAEILEFYYPGTQVQQVYQ